MRLIDLDPRWLMHGGERVAIMFVCPHCPQAPKKTWVTCFFKRAGDLPPVPIDYPVEALRGRRGERALFYEALRDMGHLDPVEGSYHDVIDCKPTFAWQRTSDDFATITVTPSIDAGAAGHWHGHIVNGEIKG